MKGEIARYAGSADRQLATDKAREIGGYAVASWEFLESRISVKGIPAILVLGPDAPQPIETDIVCDFRRVTA